MQGFNSSTQRFKPLTKRPEPGPGAYDMLDQYNFVTDLQRKTHGRHGVFGSTTRRFHSLKRDQVPGAGSYDPAAAGEAPGDEREEQNSSAFASSVARFAKSAPTTIVKGKKQLAEAPPPWKYNVKSQNAWDQQQSDLRSDQTFGSKVERFPTNSISGGKVRVVPGPGAYHRSCRRRVPASSRHRASASGPKNHVSHWGSVASSLARIRDRDRGSTIRRSK